MTFTTGFLIVGFGVGVAISALGHPSIYKAVFGGRKKTLDDKGC
ncbi:MAG: hypothetical protein AAFQ67_06595 [Pseudomonadota bacterium]